LLTGDAYAPNAPCMATPLVWVYANVRESLVTIYTLHNGGNVRQWTEYDAQFLTNVRGMVKD